MKLCTSYYQDENHKNKADQIRFSMYNLNNALSYLMLHERKSIIIEILSMHEMRDGHQVCPSIEVMKQLQIEHDITYDFYLMEDLLEYRKNCIANDDAIYKYFYHYPVSTWGMVRILLESQVSDIVLGEPLVFMKNEVEKYIHPYAKTRAYPHKGKPSLALEFTSLPAINHFFVLPQWVEAYDFIDTFDLLDDNIARESALLDIYKEPQYIYKLSHVVPSITSNITGAYIDNDFVTKRLNCNQTCLKNPNGCHYCEMYEKMYSILEKQHANNIEPADGES